MIDKDKLTDEQMDSNTLEETSTETSANNEETSSANSSSTANETEIEQQGADENNIDSNEAATSDISDVVESDNLEEKEEIQSNEEFSSPLSIAENESADKNNMHVYGEETKKGGKGLFIALALVAVAVIGVFGYFFATKSGPFAPASPDDIVAVVVGDVEVSAAEYNYMYAVSTTNFLNNNYSMLSYFNIDFTKPLSEQEYTLDPEVGSWADYFNDLTLNTIHYNYGMLDAANKAGFEASAETYESIASSLASIETGAENENLEVDEYITEFIGEGITFETVSDIITTLFIVSEYNQTIIDSVDLSQATIDAYYEENKDDFDVFTFRNMFFEGSVDGAREDAEEMLSLLTGDNFKELADEALGEETLSTLPEGYDYTIAEVDGISLYDDALKEYLLDPARAAGDTAVIEIDQGLYVVEYIGREKNTAPASVNMKHLLIAFNEDGSDPTQEQKDAALAEITALTTEWEEGGATDELFIELVTENTDDMGSATTGGVYSDVIAGDMVTEINDFLFDTNTAVGDYEIIETTFGYHLTVLTAKGAESYVMTIGDYLINDAMIAAENEVLETTEITPADNIDELVIKNIDISEFAPVG